MLKRRTFLQLAAGGAAAAHPVLSSAMARRPKKVANIGVQLWTVRHELVKDFEGTIRQLAEMGFKGFETAPLPESLSVEKAAKLYQALNMPVPACHFELPTRKNLDTIKRMTDAYQSTKLIYNSWPEKGKFETLENTQRTLDTYNEIYEMLAQNGLEFGLHNHWWEFENKTGLRPYYYLLEHINKNVFFEIDTYWTQAAGMDPAKVIKDFGKRVSMLHIKDGSAVQDDTLTDHVVVGTGAMDFPSIAKAARKNIDWMVVEFDEHKGDIFQALQKSYNYMTDQGFAKGHI